eukprot:TRINITY_DN73901_c0_g1_i1.p1 TRINITY_DN73901_c0_g1~~TRINITY_DN73901_c0_g1_i1.p1  ORF type:complete len:295 (+),score=77.71 TRINITY_DN73901_c0_g1_i1:95-979(+)
MDDDGNMDALFSSFLNEVSNVKSKKIQRAEMKSGSPEEIVEKLTNMTYDPKQGQGSAFMVLGVSPEASDSEITKAYRRLSILIHPDKCKLEKASEAFQLLSKAYADTKDPNYQDKYKDVVGKAKENVRKAREKENVARAKKGEDPLETEGNDFDQAVLGECERLTTMTKEEKQNANSVYEANMQRWANMSKEAKKARHQEEVQKKQFERQRDKRAAGWQTFLHNVESKKLKSETFGKIGKVGAADVHHQREARTWMHSEGELKGEVDLEDDKVKRSDTQAGQTGIDRSYMKAWR